MSNLGSENSTTEFKRQLTDSLEKEVVAFLNSDIGGDLYRLARKTSPFRAGM